MSVSLNDDSSRSGRSGSSDVTESREICGATVQGPMGFGRIAAADEAGPTQTDATIGRSTVVMSCRKSLRKQAWTTMYGDVCGELS